MKEDDQNEAADLAEDKIESPGQEDFPKAKKGEVVIRLKKNRAVSNIGKEGDIAAVPAELAESMIAAGYAVEVNNNN